MKIILALTIFLISSSVFSHEKSDSLINVLKAELKKAPIYDQKKEGRIAKLKRNLNKESNLFFSKQYQQYKLIFEEYKPYKYDSAFVYALKMIDLAKTYGQHQKLIESKIQLGNIYTSTGMYKEGFELILNVDTNEISDQLKSDFYNFRARLHENIAIYNEDAYFSERYFEQSRKDFTRARLTIPPNAFEKTIDQAFVSNSAEKIQLPASYFYNYITKHKITQHELAMVATRLSFAYQGDDKVMFLALAAICDIRSSIKETRAIFFLGQELFQQNKTKDAYLFIQEAVKSGRFYGSRNHQVQFESILPIIAGKLISEKQNEKNQYVISFLVFLLIALILAFVLFLYRVQLARTKINEQLIRQKNEELADVNEKLWESSRIKEEFIGLFFTNCSSHIETLEKLKHKLQHNLKGERYKEVDVTLAKINIGHQRHKLYETLDTVLLTLFPNFIVAFNQLLFKEDQIWPKNDEALNASLRIFALIRLGVTDLDAIAKILDYRVSTVYTYKMRIKSKAIVDSEEFERKIMEIKLDSKNSNLRTHTN